MKIAKKKGSRPLQKVTNPKNEEDVKRQEPVLEKNVDVSGLTPDQEKVLLGVKNLIGFDETPAGYSLNPVEDLLSLNPAELLNQASRVHAELMREDQILADLKEAYMFTKAGLDAHYADLYVKFHKDLTKATKDLILAHIGKDSNYRNMNVGLIKNETALNKQKVVVKAIQTKASMIKAMLYALSEEYKQGVKHASMMDDNDLVLED